MKKAYIKPTVKAVRVGEALMNITISSTGSASSDFSVDAKQQDLFDDED